VSNATEQPTAILIGTAQTILQMRVMLDLAGTGTLVRGSLYPSGQECGAPDSLGSFDDIAVVLAEHKPSQVLLSLPIAMAGIARELTEVLDEHEIAWRFMPTVNDLMQGNVHTPLRSKRVVDAAGIDTTTLINRTPSPLDDDAIAHVMTDRTVMITGAGGSIGSELARIVCRFSPSRLVLLERSENALFEIKRQLTRLFPDQSLVAVMHDVTNATRTHHVVGVHKPEVIFHAAAHKHVPVMEEHPAEAVENNFYGTRSMADAAAANECERFVMISTDKAVNPSSVMGASKRLAELYIQWLNCQSDTTFAMVRFGNVLGSACSVLPIWSHQLAHGHPITVTDERMTRYFMTIPEAAGLVIQSAAYSGSMTGSHGGEVFLLDMGEPVNILELAERFIRLHGLEPNVDAPIQITGARPGEKLFEELAYDGEGMLPTPHEAIRIWQTTPPDTKRMQQIMALFDGLRQSRESAGHTWKHATDEAILSALRFAVPEMVPAVNDEIRAAS